MGAVSERAAAFAARGLRLAGFFPVAILLSGCLATAITDLSQGIKDRVAPKVTFLVPAKNADAAALKSILIVSDDQRVSQHVAMDFESQLSKLRIAERPHYARVKLGPRINGVLADTQLGELARVHGVESVAVITGGNSDVKSHSRTEDRVSCAVATKLFESCPSSNQRTSKVSCTQTVGTATIRFRLYRVSDGRFVVADTMSGQSAHDKCSDDNIPYADSNQLIYSAGVSASAEALRVIAPSYQLGPLDIMAADKGVPDANKAAFDAAVEFANAKRNDEACNRFQELYLDNKESPALTFNIAFCYELVGDMLRANQSYRRASELVSRPDAQIDRRLALTEKALRENPMAFLPQMNSVASMPSLAGGVAGNKRVALVIGNARYQRNALVNPVNDARLVSDRLKRIGFEVVTLENVPSARFETGIRDFSNRAKGADVALFYYAGHALQADGENYLMPVDNEKMRTMEDVRDGGSIQLASVLAMLDVASPVVKMVVIDACRDNPLPSASRSIGGGGLAAISKAPRGGVIAYATAPGRTAEDGVGRNSTFSKHFAAQVVIPNQTIEQLFKRVREAVKAETKNRQEPIETSNLMGDVMLVQAATK